MAETRKVLGQSAPAAATPTDLYTVPAATQAVVSSLEVCTRVAGLHSFRVSVSVAGAATANKDYLYYDIEITHPDAFIATVGWTLGATDKVRVYASTADLSFNLFGVEIT